MTTEEAIKQIDGAEMVLINRDFKKFQTASIMAINALRSQQEQERNEPLTLDELQQMRVQPVWIESPEYEYDFPGRWEILEISGKGMWDGIHGEYFESDYGNMWIAYRHKKKSAGGGLRRTV